MDFKNTLRSYYYLAKPGIVYGNAIAAAAGFFFASKGNYNWQKLTAFIIGSSLIIGSACVINNYIDRGIDKKMDRTRNRALATGKISGVNAIIYSSVLGLLGFFILFLFTNTLTMTLGLIGLIDYVFLYGISKRKSVHGTLIGSISGAIPPVAGYTTVTNHLDIAALLLFIIFTVWQMPHFYGIAIYRLNDYKKAKIPVLPVVKGIKKTKVQIVVYILLFIISSILLTIYGYTGVVYLILSVLVGFCWLYLSIKGFYIKDERKWSKQLFLSSLLVMVLVSIFISIGPLLP